MASEQRHTLFDMPVSNAGARCRMVIYLKGLEDQVTFASPFDIGGLKSAEYLRLNPQGKVPCLVLPSEQAVWESDTIVRYLEDQFSNVTPCVLGQDVLQRVQVNSMVRHHDMYIQPIQGSMYKPAPPFSTFDNRRDAHNEILKQLTILEDMAQCSPFLAGSEITLADCTVFPTAVFIKFMLPKYGIADKSIFGPKLTGWWEHMCQHSVGARVKEEITTALNKWETKGRWNDCLGAGARDEKPRTIFDRIISKEIQSTVVFEDDRCLAFKDICPQAPVHFLVIPKQRDCLTQIRFATDEHKGLLGHLMGVAAKLGREHMPGGFRIVINDDQAGGQTVYHLHIHVLGGRTMTWPPG